MVGGKDILLCGKINFIKMPQQSNLNEKLTNESNFPRGKGLGI